MKNVTKSVGDVLGFFINSLKKPYSIKCPNSGKKVEFKRYLSKGRYEGFSGLPPETVPDVNELVGCCPECVNEAEKYFKKLWLTNVAKAGEQYSLAQSR